MPTIGNPSAPSSAEIALSRARGAATSSLRFDFSFLFTKLSGVFLVQDNATTHDVEFRGTNLDCSYGGAYPRE